ncbi:hypothetical protein XFLM_01420 [Xylella fastidiosa subsp. fastidiosa GB514]|nr:hypothetical protein XFLM_01420 [Xylella fastidiosa subsp. fastidiosa GB514]
MALQQRPQRCQRDERWGSWDVLLHDVLKMLQQLLRRELLRQQRLHYHDVANNDAAMAA